jgi:hypothetical protein
MPEALGAEINGEFVEEGCLGRVHIGRAVVIVTACPYYSSVSADGNGEAETVIPCAV